MGDNDYNKKVIKDGGEIIVAQRERNRVFNQAELIPCSSCFLRLKESTVSKHRKCRCITLKFKQKSNLSKKGLSVLQGRMLRGDYKAIQGSTQLLEIIGNMKITEDSLKKVVIEEYLIRELGDEWLSKGSRNKLKRKITVSERMRLSACLLIKCRELGNCSSLSMHNLLAVDKFDLIMQGVLVLSGKNNDEDMNFHLLQQSLVMIY